MEPLSYQSGFANNFATEALPGALPAGQNSPQRCAYGLYAEQLSGTAFTAPRAANRRSWLYRIRPAAVHSQFRPVDFDRLEVNFRDYGTPPDQLRWSPLPIPKSADFVEGLFTLAGNGDAAMHTGCRVMLYGCNRSMKDRYFYDADGELLIVPQEGTLRLATEMGRLDVGPREMAVIPRGVRFRVELGEDAVGGARGYVCENLGAPFRLPDLGPIGSNGLANARDFLTPVAWYEDLDCTCELVCKFLDRTWAAELHHSPLDVVAWHGNHAPYKYDLRLFNTIGSVSYDHPDPSIFLVMTSPTDTPGADSLQFVIFPPRWSVSEHSFRPPWYHRNIASEFMGLVDGAYEAKTEGFLPGGASLHNCMIGHGPDAGAYEQASSADVTKPERMSDSLAIMFESRWPFRVARQALEADQLQADYQSAWQDLKKHFTGSP